MAEHVIPAVLTAGLNIIESILRTKYEELRGVSKKVERLEWLFLKIRCAIEESNKYDIHNGLREMQQKFVDAALETEELLNALRSSKNLSTASDYPPVKFSPRIFLVPRHSLPEKLNQPEKEHFSNKNNFFQVIWKIEKVNRLLEKLEEMSNDVGIFLEMVRQQKQKRERRRMCRPCKHFFELVYLNLVQDAVDYCRAQMLWMQFLLPGMANLVNANRKSGDNGSHASISAVPKVWLDVLNFLRKSLQLV